jgi:hypothetical protein
MSICVGDWHRNDIAARLSIIDQFVCIEIYNVTYQETQQAGRLPLRLEVRGFFAFKKYREGCSVGTGESWNCISA